MEDEARSWMAEVRSQKARAKSQDRDDERDREIECRMERTGLKKVYDEQKEEAATGA
jgi:hypothetical protein